MAFVLRRQGHWAESAEAMRKALELDPKNAVLAAGFAEACIFLRRYAEADRAYGLVNRPERAERRRLRR